MNQQLQPVWPLLRRLWSQATVRRHRQFQLLVILMVLASISEIVSIGAILPFLSVLTVPEKVFAHPATQPLIALLGLQEPADLLMPLTVGFAIAVLVSTGMRLLMQWGSTRFSYAAGADISIAIFQRALHQPYAVHLARNSSEVINGITKRSDNVTAVILGLLNLVGSWLILVSILSSLLFIEPLVAGVAFGGFGLAYLLITWVARHRLDTNSQRVYRESTQALKVLREGLGGIRDVLIDGTQRVYCDRYAGADFSMRQALGANAFIGFSPRYIMEGLGMVAIAALAYGMSLHPNGIAAGIPVLGALGLGAQRLLPLLQQVYQGWTTVRGSRASVQGVVEMLEQPLPRDHDQSPQALPFRREIAFCNLGFRYGPELPWVFREVNLTISRGERIGIIGVTGSGKSTLLDIVMGLLEPTVGTMVVDGVPLSVELRRAWQAHIAHVPQTIFLVDASIEENIAFGVPRGAIDRQRVRRAAEQAQIAEHIESLAEGYGTPVGERGVRLSGGQRQRLGIARALYKNADVIVLDEATSALDSATEEAVMKVVYELSDDLTIMIIAHRLTTLKDCDQIIELGKGCLKRVYRYEDLQIG